VLLTRSRHRAHFQRRRTGDMTTTNTDPASDVRHETFTVTRNIDFDRAATFAAFADDRVRRRWFRIPGAGATYDHDFQVGGGEDARSTFAMPDGLTQRVRNRSRYLDIVPDHRIVFVYEAIIDDVTRWASLVTVTFTDDEGGGSILTWTEQAAFLTRTGDGSADLPHLRTGTTLRLNGLSAAIEAGRSEPRDDVQRPEPGGALQG
jgi:uncharacterized protein YndB with AHSA1/START domain